MGMMGEDGLWREGTGKDIYHSEYVRREALESETLAGHGLGGVSSFDPGIHVCGADRY